MGTRVVVSRHHPLASDVHVEESPGQRSSSASASSFVKLCQGKEETMQNHSTCKAILPWDEIMKCINVE